MSAGPRAPAGVAPEPREAPRPARWPLLVLLAIAGRSAWLLSAAWPFTTDDAFIALRYARSLAAGDGITFNPGEQPPTEGYSSFSFVLLGAAALRLGLDPVVVLKLAGAAALMLEHAALYVVSRRVLGTRMALVPVLWLTAQRPMAHWSASGLETAVYQLACTAAVLCWMRAHGYAAVDEALASPVRAATRRFSPRWLCAAMVVVLFGALTRPEGPLIGVALLGASLFELGRRRELRATWRSLAYALACFAVPYAAYYAFRTWHFGRLLPNSVLCKAGHPEDPSWLLRDFAVHAWPYLVACLPLAWRWRTLDGRHLALALPLLLYAAAMYDVDPIIGHLMRHFLAPFALLLPLSALGLWRLLARARRPRRLALVVLCLVAAWTSVGVWLERPRVAGYARAYAARMQARAQLATWLERELPPSAGFAIGDTGLVAYATRARVIDLLCLNSGFATRPPVARDPARYAAAVLARSPDALVLSSQRADALVPPPEYPIFRELARQPGFARYRPAASFAAPGDPLAYRVYLRSPL